MARGDWRRARDGREYQDWRFFPEDVQERALRFRTSRARARSAIIRIRNLWDKLLTVKTDARRAAIINLLRRRLMGGYTQIEDFAVLAKIANSAPGELPEYVVGNEEEDELDD